MKWLMRALFVLVLVGIVWYEAKQAGREVGKNVEAAIARSMAF